MADDEEIFRIIAQVQGRDDVARLTAEVEKQENHIRQLIAGLKSGAVTQYDYARGTKAAAVEVARLTQELQKAQKATAQIGRSGSATQGLTQLGYTVDDLQYGFKGIANNIQPLLSTIPALAGIAPVLAIAATAAYQLYTHWDQITELFGTGATKTEAQRMEELKDKTEKTADETERLLKYERERKSLATQNAPTTKAVETQDAVSEALREVGRDRINEAVNRIHGDRLRNSVSDEKTQAARRAKGKLNDAQGTLDEMARQEPGQVSAHAMDQARKNRDKAQADYGKALDAFNKEYGERRDKLKAQLATDLNDRGEPEKLQKFLEEAGKRGLLTSKEIESLRNSTPEAKAQREAEAQDHKERMDLESRAAKSGEDERHRAIQEGSAGMAEKFSPAILNNVARGHANDPAALSAAISRTLQAGGKAKEAADEIAPQIADDLLKKVGLRVKERSNQEGLTKEEAAAREAEDDAAAARSRAPKPHGAINDIAGFASSLQMSVFAKKDPIQQAILEENRKQATRLEELVNETRKVKPRNGQVAVAAGPG